MLVEDWRILEISIFATIQNNLSCVDFRQLLLDALTNYCRRMRFAIEAGSARLRGYCIGLGGCLGVPCCLQDTIRVHSYEASPTGRHAVAIVNI